MPATSRASNARPFVSMLRQQVAAAFAIPGGRASLVAGLRRLSLPAKVGAGLLLAVQAFLWFAIVQHLIVTSARPGVFGGFSRAVADLQTPFIAWLFVVGSAAGLWWLLRSVPPRALGLIGAPLPLALWVLLPFLGWLFKPAAIVDRLGIDRFMLGPIMGGVVTIGLFLLLVGVMVAAEVSRNRRFNTGPLRTVWHTDERGFKSQVTIGDPNHVPPAPRGEAKAGYVWEWTGKEYAWLQKVTSGNPNVKPAPALEPEASTTHGASEWVSPDDLPGYTTPDPASRR